MTITVGDLIKRLEIENKDSEIYFEGLEFLRVKRRSDDLVQIEFTKNIDMLNIENDDEIDK